MRGSQGRGTKPFTLILSQRERGQGKWITRDVMRRSIVSLLWVALWIMLISAEAGHELPYYPSFYPHEIRVEVVPPEVAATHLQQGTLQAYIGATPHFSEPPPAHVSAVSSLGAYLVVTFDGAAALQWQPEQRCTVAQDIVSVLAKGATTYVFHPYPVTPYHGDYLYHFDRVEALQVQYLQRPAGRREASPHPLTVRGHDALAAQLVRPQWQHMEQPWDATVEEIDVESLLASHTSSLNGWLGPAWLKAGWFHAYLLLAETVHDPQVKAAVATTYERLVHGSYTGLEARLNAERELVALLQQGCERVVVGYTLRQEYVNTEFSAGIENLAYDSHTGLNSSLFVRTVKLKDLPWNGWLKLGVSTPPAAAWNPIAGLTDATGRLLWHIVGDVAFFPAPYNGGWVVNRIADYQARRGSAGEREWTPGSEQR